MRRRRAPPTETVTRSESHRGGPDGTPTTAKRYPVAAVTVGRLAARLLTGSASHARRPLVTEHLPPTTPPHHHPASPQGSTRHATTAVAPCSRGGPPAAADRPAPVHAGRAAAAADASRATRPHPRERRGPGRRVPTAAARPQSLARAAQRRLRRAAARAHRARPPPTRRVPPSRARPQPRRRQRVWVWRHATRRGVGRRRVSRDGCQRRAGRHDRRPGLTTPPPATVARAVAVPTQSVEGGCAGWRAS